jgi:iron complex outermembrane receptor protein
MAGGMMFALRDNGRWKVLAALVAVLPCLPLLPAIGATNLVDKSAAELADLSLKQLMEFEVPTVVTASKHAQKVTEAPSSVTVITADEIKKYGYRTLAEILNSVAGLFVRTDRTYALLGVRGFGQPGDFNSRFLLLVDGHRVNAAVNDIALIDNGFIVDVDLIERVEIVRGPGSSLYGDNAILGVINVITRRGRDLNGAEASGTAGSFDSYKGRFSYGGLFSNGVEFVLSGTYFHSDGQPRLFFKEFNDPATNNGIARNADSDLSKSIFATVSYRDWSLEGAYVIRTKQIPTASYGTVFNDPGNEIEESHAFTELKYQHLFANDLNVMARVAYDRSTTLGTYIVDYAAPGDPPDIFRNEDDFLGQSVTGELQLRRTFFEKHAVTLGVESVENLDQNQRNSDVSPIKTVYLNDRRNGLDYAFYLQDEYQILHNLIFNGGVRYDEFYTSGSSVNPRLALIYDPVEPTTLKFIYGTAFRAPSVEELYYQDGGFSQLPSPNLKPEVITTYEFIAEQRIGSHLRATAAGFYYEIKNLVQAGTDPGTGLFKLTNLGSANAKGLELGVDGKWARGWQGRASYSLTDARDGVTDVRLADAPLHLAKLNVIAPLWQEKIFAGLELQYTSDRKTLAGKNAEGFVTANLTLFSRELLKGVELSASIYNLFDTKYGAPGGPELLQDAVPQDGRTWRVKVTYRF